MPVPQNFNPSVPPPLENTWVLPPTSVPPLNMVNFPPPLDALFSQDKNQKISPRGPPKKQGWSPREESAKDGNWNSGKKGRRRDSGGEEKKWAQVSIYRQIHVKM